MIDLRQLYLKAMNKSIAFRVPIERKSAVYDKIVIISVEIPPDRCHNRNF